MVRIQTITKKAILHDVILSDIAWECDWYRYPYRYSEDEDVCDLSKFEIELLDLLRLLASRIFGSDKYNFGRLRAVDVIYDRHGLPWELNMSGFVFKKESGRLVGDVTGEVSFDNVRMINGWKVFEFVPAEVYLSVWVRE